MSAAIRSPRRQHGRQGHLSGNGRPGPENPLSPVSNRYCAPPTGFIDARMTHSLTRP